MSKKNGDEFLLNKILQKRWDEFRNRQQDWLDILYEWAEKEIPWEMDWEYTERRIQERDFTKRVKEASEAVVRYTASTQTKNTADLRTLFSHIKERRKEIDIRLDGLAGAVDRIIQITDEQAMQNPSNTPSRDEGVILLHGLARSNLSMIRMEQNLRNQGYKTLNIDYPSTECSIEYLVDQYVIPAAEQFSDLQRVHFVTHSMGGILVRFLHRYHRLDNFGRVVMLSPPNKGSEIVDMFADLDLFYQLNGPAGLQLGTNQESMPKMLGTSVDFPLGILMGDRPFEPVLPMLIRSRHGGVNDGKVSIESAKINGMTDFMVLPHSHTFIMHSPQVIEQAIHFLEKETFRR